MKSITLKRWLRLGFSKGWTSSDEKSYQAGLHAGIKKGLDLARQQENQRKRLSREKSKLAKQLA